MQKKPEPAPDLSLLRNRLALDQTTWDGWRAAEHVAADNRTANATTRSNGELDLMTLAVKCRECRQDFLADLESALLMGPKHGIPQMPACEKVAECLRGPVVTPDDDTLLAARVEVSRLIRAVQFTGSTPEPVATEGNGATEGDPASGAGGPKDEPTDTERDTYYVYRAVEAMLMAEHDASSVTQMDVHAAAPALLRDRIDREAIGVSGGYKVQPTFGAFRKAFKRAEAKLSARRG